MKIKIRSVNDLYNLLAKANVLQEKNLKAKKRINEISDEMKKDLEGRLAKAETLKDRSELQNKIQFLP